MALPLVTVLAFVVFAITMNLRNPQAAMARLRTVQAQWSESNLQEHVRSDTEDALIGVFLFVGVVFSLAFVSRRLPVATATLNFAVWLIFCARTRTSAHFISN